MFSGGLAIRLNRKKKSVGNDKRTDEVDDNADVGMALVKGVKIYP